MASAGPRIDLFAYGVLMYPELLEALLGQPVEMLEASAPNHQRYTVRKAGYPPFPALVPEAGIQVAGVLVVGLNQAAVSRLDDFEEVDTGLYRRQPIEVMGPAKRLRRAQAYLAGPGLGDCLGKVWNPDRFAEQFFADYRDRVIPQFLAGVSDAHRHQTGSD